MKKYIGQNLVESLLITAMYTVDYMKERILIWIYCIGMTVGLCMIGAECKSTLGMFLVSISGLAVLIIFGALFFSKCEASELKRWEK